MEKCRLKTLNYPNIEFKGFVKNVADYYHAAHVYMQPSFTESLGIGVLGALAYKLPCIVTRVGGMQESVINNVNGFTLPEKDLDLFSSKILALVNDESLRIDMGEKGLQHYQRLFTPGEWENNMRDIIYA